MRVVLCGVVGAALVWAQSPPAGPVAVPACHPAVLTGSLPVWARGGFSPPTQHIPHVLGRHGRIVAILFADPLLSPPPKDHRNKVLWVARSESASRSRLLIGAQRMDGTRNVGRPVRLAFPGGPGPSYVDLPEPGCWRLALRWTGGRSDTLDLRVVARP